MACHNKMVIPFNPAAVDIIFRLVCKNRVKSSESGVRYLSLKGCITLFKWEYDGMAVATALVIVSARRFKEILVAPSGFDQPKIILETRTIDI